MVEEQKFEPRYHKRDTLLKLYACRQKDLAALDAIRAAEDARNALMAECSLLEKEAVEWMKRNKTETEVLLRSVTPATNVDHVIVFTLNKHYDRIYDQVVTPTR